MNNQPSNAVLFEMLKNVKEEQLPSMEDRISLRLDALTEQVKKTNGSVKDHTQDIQALQHFKAAHESSKKTWVYVVSLILAITGIVIAIVSKLP